MKIVTRYRPLFIRERGYDWRALDQDTYDGAEDSPTRYQIGWGRTEEEAIADLRRLLNEAAEADICPNCGQPEGIEHSC